MKAKQHIWDGNSTKSLCGRDSWELTLLCIHVDNVFCFTKAKRKIFKIEWCKICKMLYNANHSKQGKILK